jgi:hypothetical protein
LDMKGDRVGEIREIDEFGKRGEWNGWIEVV